MSGLESTPGKEGESGKGGSRPALGFPGGSRASRHEGKKAKRRAAPTTVPSRSESSASLSQGAEETPLRSPAPAPPGPERRSIRDRIVALDADPNPLVETGMNLFGNLASTTSTFSIASTGELVLDEAMPLPLTVEREAPQGELDQLTAAAYHLLLLPEEASADDLEALAISVWNEAGWLSPGVIRLQENVTLEGPFAVSRATRDYLGSPPSLPQVWLLRCPPARGAAPTEAVIRWDKWAQAFPEGMPVGLELKTLEVLRRVARRLSGALRIAGSGQLIQPEIGPTVALRVYSDQWIPPATLSTELGFHLTGISFAQSPPEEPGTPYAILAEVSPASQVLIGVRPEPFAPRALRFDRWAQRNLNVYEVVWAPPADLASTNGLPSRREKREQTRALQIAETAAAVIAASTTNAAVIDEDGFLLSLSEPPPEEALQHP